MARMGRGKRDCSGAGGEEWVGLIAGPLGKRITGGLPESRNQVADFGTALTEGFNEFCQVG
jgi:hypothetical protein